MQTVNYDKCMDNFTPLFTAAEFGYVEIFRSLVYKGCDFNLLGPNNMTVGHVICQNAHPVEMLNILFDKNHEVELDLSVKDGLVGPWYKYVKMLWIETRNHIIKSRLRQGV